MCLVDRESKRIIASIQSDIDVLRKCEQSLVPYIELWFKKHSNNAGIYARSIPRDHANAQRIMRREGCVDCTQ